MNSYITHFSVGVTDISYLQRLFWYNNVIPCLSMPMLAIKTLKCIKALNISYKQR